MHSLSKRMNFPCSQLLLDLVTNRCTWGLWLSLAYRPQYVLILLYPTLSYFASSRSFHSIFSSSCWSIELLIYSIGYTWSANHSIFCFSQSGVICTHSLWLSGLGRKGWERPRDGEVLFDNLTDLCKWQLDSAESLEGTRYSSLYHIILSPSFLFCSFSPLIFADSCELDDQATADTVVLKSGSCIQSGGDDVYVFCDSGVISFLPSLLL